MMEFSKKQKEFWNNATHRWNIKQGATRSGKTFLDYYIIPKRIRACTGTGLIVLIGNTKGTLNRNILDPMRNIWGEGLVGNVGGDGTVELFGRKAYVIGADRANQVSKLQGAGIEYCYGDEITTWCEPVFTMLKSRLDKPNSIFDGTCNPDNPSHWFKRFLDSDADIFLQHYTIDDNPFNSPEFVKNLKNEYKNTVYYDRFILGKWVAAEGLVYPMFSESRHIKKLEKDPEGTYYVSIDYGTVNPTSMGLWCVAEGEAVRVREYYHDSRTKLSQLTDEEYYTQLENLAEGHIISEVIIDPSAASFIQTIKRHGRFSVKKANNNVLNGIRTTSTFLQNNKLFFSQECRDILREFGMYCWDTAAAEDRVIKQHDHAMDDMRYFCNTILKKMF